MEERKRVQRQAKNEHGPVLRAMSRQSVNVALNFVLYLA